MVRDMIDPIEFFNIMNSRDIRKVIKWLENEYRRTIVPLVKEYPLLRMIEESTGQEVGKALGNYAVQRYVAATPEEKCKWDSGRWLHHGAVGELIVFREQGRRRPFLIGLGKGLMLSDLQDMGDWHTLEFHRQKALLEKIR